MLLGYLHGCLRVNLLNLGFISLFALGDEFMGATAASRSLDRRCVVHLFRPTQPDVLTKREREKIVVLREEGGRVA
jgi:hypothetical protein